MSISDEGVVCGVESGIVLDPTRRVPEGWRLMIVPFTVAAGPPAEMVVPAMEKTEGLGVNVWPATVYTLLEGRRSTVELPIANAPD